ncbi:MAG: hypothetical protein A2X94_02950 [Bdellovibrionales bacterium GWB1_55_8]|nr:MAG: hypothetical protein A2X94_02950 [Bdellovibrionales bacterium GWB1_55_8]
MPSKKATIENVRVALKRLKVRHEIEQIEPETNLFNTGALDSLALIQFVLSLEEEFSITLDYNDIQFDHFKSFSDIQRLLKSKYGC